MSESTGTTGEPRDSPRSARSALVVAVTEYVDPELRRLRAPAGDAAALREVLADPDVGAFEVTSVIDADGQRIRLEVEDFLTDRRPDDVLLVYLSCHGLVDLRRRLYFAARDTRKDRLAASGVEAHWLLEQLDDCRARRQVVILDCCFSGAFALGSKGGDTDLGIGERLLGQGRGRVVLTASRATEYSFEGEPVRSSTERGSVFTSALVKGISSGAADTDGDGYISVDDAYAYAFDAVKQSGAPQTPQRWLYGAEGDIVLARNPASAQPGPRASEAGESTTVTAPPAAPSATRGTRRRLTTYLLAGAALLAAAVLVPVVVTLDQRGSVLPPAAHGTFSQRAPWRLQIKDGISSPHHDNGCQVSVTNANTDDRTQENGVYGTSSFQMHGSGRFRWEANDKACLVFAKDGAGKLDLPFAWPVGIGDTDAFRSPGRVAVDVTGYNGGSTCDLGLVSVTNGQPLDFKTAHKGHGPVVMTSNGPASVYLKDVTCKVRVSPAS